MPGKRCMRAGVDSAGVEGRQRERQEGPTARETPGPGSIAPHPVMAHPDAADREDREQKPPEKLRGRSGHNRHPRALAALAPLQQPLSILEGHEARMTAGHPVRIAAPRGDDLPRTSNRRRGIDDPVRGPGLVKPRRQETPLSQGGGRATALESVLGKGFVESVEVRGPEDLREGPHRQQAGPACGREPLCLVGGEGAARDDAGAREVLLQGLALRMQHYREAQGPSEPLGSTAKGW